MHPVQQVVNKGVQIRELQGRICGSVVDGGQSPAQKNAGEPVHVPITSQRTKWRERWRVLTFDRLILLVPWLALTDGQNKRENVKLLSYQPVDV